MPSPYIKYIKLPGSSGVYTIRDPEAWDANISGTLQYQINQMQDGTVTGTLQNQIDNLSEMIAGGVNFNIVWTSVDYAAAYPYGPTLDKLAQIPKDVTVYYDNGTKNAKGTLEAASTTKGTFYLIYSKSQAGDKDLYDEYVTITNDTFPVTYSWEKIGDTQIDLSGIVTDVSVSTTSATVLGAGSTFTAPSQTVGSKNTFTTDNVLGEDTTFQLTSGVVTHGSLSGHTDSVLGADTTFEVTQPTITVTPTMRYLKATAANGAVSGTTRYLDVSITDVAIGGNGTANAVTGYGSTTSDSFVKSVSAETNKKLVTTSIGTDTVSKVTKTDSKLVTTKIPNVTGNTTVNIPNVTGNTNVSIPNVTDVGTSSTWSFQMGNGNDSETLIISGGNSTTPTLGAALSASKVTLGNQLTATNTTLGTSITAATGAVASTGSGAAVVTSVGITDKTVAQISSAITVATGATASDGEGDAIVTGVTIGESGYAITALGTPTTATVLTGVRVTTQPTATLSKSLLSGTVSYLESVTMDNQPTITLTASTNSLVGPGVVAGISSATAAGATVTASNNDNVTTIISMPTSSVGTAITVGTNDKVSAVTGFTGTGLVIPSQTITVSASEVNAVTSVSLSLTKG